MILSQRMHVSPGQKKFTSEMFSTDAFIKSDDLEMRQVDCLFLISFVDTLYEHQVKLN